jgi:GntR family transcriptional regulator of abcA and norABC
MSTAPPDWGKYLRAGTFQENVPTIQVINKLEFKEGIIRLGTGELSPDLFPAEMMRSIYGRLPDRIPSLNYLGSLGLLELRQALSKKLKKQGIDADPSCILITSGSLQALQLISVCMLKPGSVVYTEAPSYLKSLQVFPSAGMKLSGIPMDRDGILYWNIAAEGRSLENSLLYTIPTYHNPTGTVMSDARRQELFRFCTNNRLPIIEDNAYGELWLEDEPPIPLKAMDRNGMILYLGTISKTLAPGLRIGWLAGPESVVERLGDVKMQIDYGASSLSQWALAELLSSGLYDEYLISLRRKLKLRRDFVLSLLDKHFQNIAQWDVPKGSFYIWLRLMVDVPADQLFQRMLEHQILINPGNVYDFEKNHAIRLSYSYAKEEELEYGIEMLARTIRRMGGL